MTISFIVDRPLSINRMYGRGRGKRFFITKDGAAFKERIRSVALAARARSKWPADPWRVLKAEISYQLYDYAGDTDGPRKAIRDCLEEILYVNDKVVQDGPAPLPIADGKGARVEVTVKLIELARPEQAKRMRELAQRDRAMRARRPKKKCAA